MVNTESSTEWLDSVLSLNPPSLKQLGVEYILVSKNAEQRIKNFGVDLSNLNYFKPIYNTANGLLYKVDSTYKELPNQPQSITKLIENIPLNKTIYLDTFKLNEIRRGLVLHLAKKSHLIGPGFSAGGDYFMYAEVFLPFTYICEAPYLPKCESDIISKYEPIDYIITQPDKDIRSISIANFRKFISTPLVIVWERVL